MGSAGLVGSVRRLLGIALGGMAMSAAAFVAPRLPETSLVGGLAVGVTARSLAPATVFEALDRTRQAGAAILEIDAGQTLSPSSPEAAVREDMTEEQLAALRRKLALTAGKIIAVRVRFSNNLSANTRLFEWADALGIELLVGEPTPDQLDGLERLVRRFNLGVGLVAGPRPSSRLPADPEALMRLLRGRDPRLGVVAPLVDLLKAGHDPFEVLETFRTRLVGVQVSDVSRMDARARPVPFGTGAFDFRRFLSQLDAQRFQGYIVFDWPADREEFRDDLAKVVQFFRREMDGIRRSNLLRLASRSAQAAAGFAYEVLAQGGIPEPIHVAACPDGSMWFGSRRGLLWSWSAASTSPAPLAELAVLTTGQRGLHGFVFDPGFLTNGHLYVYRSPMLPVGNSNRVSRFTALRRDGAWHLDLASERILLDIPSATHGQGQGGGFLLHPRDGALYVGVGDNNLPSETPRFFDNPAIAAQDPGSLWGKVLRILPDGGVPADNPFRATPGARAEVYALGLRNPFSMTCDAETGRVFVGDVGYDRRRDFEEVNLLAAGANYGWPRCDGSGRDTLGETPCPIPDAVEPWFAYPHESAAAVVVGPFLGRPARGWPEQWGPGLVYGDFARRSIRFAAVDAATGRVTNNIALVTGLAGGPVSMALAADGSLYFVEYAGWLNSNPEDRFSRLVPRPPSAQGP